MSTTPPTVPFTPCENPRFRAELMPLVRDRLEQLCEAIAAQDLAGHAVYVLFASEICGAAGLACRGITAAGLDLGVRPHVELWRGRGAAMILQDEHLWDVVDLQMTAQLGAEVRALVGVQYIASRAAERWASVTVHELAHAVVAGIPYEADTPTPEKSAAAADFVAGVARDGDVPDACPALHIASHGPSWIRAAAHLAYRASQAGAAVDVEELLGGEVYGHSPAAEYIAAMGNEPAARAGESIQSILATPVPEAFARLWNEDLVARVTPALVAAGANPADVLMRYPDLRLRDVAPVESPATVEAAAEVEATAALFAEGSVLEVPPVPVIWGTN